MESALLLRPCQRRTLLRFKTIADECLKLDITGLAQTLTSWMRCFDTLWDFEGCSW